VASRAVPPLLRNLAALANVVGLKEEVVLLRASIRELAQPGTDAAEHVKILAELRHQIEALCITLKTQQALDGRGGHERRAALDRVLEELGDDVGVSR
jgi:hypothetical protein